MRNQQHHAMVQLRSFHDASVREASCDQDVTPELKSWCRALYMKFSLQQIIHSTLPSLPLYRVIVEQDLHPQQRNAHDVMRRSFFGVASAVVPAMKFSTEMH